MRTTEAQTVPGNRVLSKNVQVLAFTKTYLKSIFTLNTFEYTWSDTRLGMSVTTQSGSGRQYVGSGRQYVTGS